MAEPIPVGSDLKASSETCAHAPTRFASLALVLEIALALRVVAAAAIEWGVRRGGAERLCLFPDTRVYWELARMIRLGAPYEVLWWGDIPHFALRTPGYPLFLACCQALFGERTLAVRLVQAFLGTLCVFLVYRLTRELALTRETQTGGAPGHATPTGQLMSRPATAGRPACRWSAPLVAAALVTLHPYDVSMSALILSEAVFQPLMLASLWGLSVLWPHASTAVVAEGAGPSRARSTGGRKAALLALFTGIAAGAAVLVRPSWALFVPAVLVLWAGLSVVHRNAWGTSATRALFCICGLVLVLVPWWARNVRVYGRLVPTALWMGASLYDGLSFSATGASDMAFLSEPDVWPLDEQDQDAELVRRAAAIGREEPRRALRLALVKLCRYWSPWPNAEGFRSLTLAACSAVMELPLFALVALGAWNRRRDLRALTVLAGPVVYFCAVHVVFASSMRYRIPGEMPALGLAAFGWMRLAERRQASEDSQGATGEDRAASSATSADARVTGPPTA